MHEFSGPTAGPNAVTSACGLSYTYDANGRMVTRGSGEITWTSFDKPSQIDDDSDTYYTQFWYGPDRARYKQYNSETGATTVYIGQLFEYEDNTTDIYRHYVQAGDRVVAIVERDDVGDPDDERMYLHRDNQGSVTKITDDSGNVSQALAFDAWGLRRDATDWSALTSPFAGSHDTERGYTGHEHLDTVGLIHMNGRVQDPILGRFISADPVIQAPYNTQSHNRYSYVWNNPSSMVDPSGFDACEGTAEGSCHDDGSVTVTAKRISDAPEWSWYLSEEPGASWVDDYESWLMRLAVWYEQSTDVPYGADAVLVPDEWTSANGPGKGRYEAFNRTWGVGRNGPYYGAIARFNYRGNVKDARWVQTVTTDMPTEKNPGDGLAFVDSLRMDSAEIHFYYPDERRDQLIDTFPGLRFQDTPQRDPKASGFWRAELSVVLPNGSGGYQRVLTFSYGFDKDGKNISLYPVESVDQPSQFHQYIINRIHY